MNYKNLTKIAVYFFAFLYCSTSAYAQFVGVGTTKPTTALDVVGALQARENYISSVRPETIVDSSTLVNNGNITMAANDSMIRLFDPGGPLANYLPSLTSRFTVTSATGTGEVEISIDEMRLNDGDAVDILLGPTPTQQVLLYRFLKNDTATFKFTTTTDISIVFTSNPDALVNRGFNIAIRRLYKTTTSSTFVPSSFSNSAVHSLTGVNAYPFGSMSIGRNNILPKFLGNIVFGEGNRSQGSNNFISGTNNFVIGGSFVGGSSNSLGSGAVVLGNNNETDSPGSSIIGSDNKVYGDGGDEGFNASVFGFNNNIGRGDYHTIIGSFDTTGGSEDIILGNNNRSFASNVLMAGSHLQLSTPFAVVVGQYNENLPFNNSQFFIPSDPLFVLGNGNSSTRSNAMVTLRNGNTGIGINTPIARMHVREKTIIDQPAATGLSSLEFRSNGLYRGAFGYDQGNGRFFMFDGESGLNAFFVNNGRFGIRRDATTNALEVDGNASKSSAGDWLANSDARLKKNIQPLQGALNYIKKLQGITYEWNDSKTGITRPSGIQYGFTAQNIQEVFPSLVQKDAQGYLQTAYGTYDALIIQALKEQQVIIEALQQKIQLLEEAIKK